MDGKCASEPEKRQPEVSSSVSSDDTSIQRYYHFTLLKVTVTTVVAIVVLMCVQLWVLLTHAETFTVQALEQKVSSLSSLGAGFTSQLTAMRRTAERYYGAIGNGAPPMLVPIGNDGVMSLDGLPETQRTTQGNLFYLPSEHDDPAERQRLLGAAKLLFELQVPFHQANPHATLSYLSAYNITSIFPWVSRTDLETAMGMNVPGLFERLNTGGFEFWNKVLPVNNSHRESLWSTPYLDAAGNGIMVTYAAPVYSDDRFLGVVAIDITLSSLSNLIRNHEMLGGEILLVDVNENVIAASSMPEKAMEFRKLSGQLSESVALSAKELKPGGLFLKAVTDTPLVYVRDVSGTPWRLVYVLPMWDLFVNVVLVNIAEVGGFFVILAMAFFVIHSFIVQNFLRPAMGFYTQTEELLRCAERANLAKSSLLANASHDLRQPLQALNLFAFALDKDESDAKKKETIASIRNCTDTIGSLVTTLLDNTRLEAGIIHPNMQKFSVDQLIKRITDEMAPIVKMKNLQLDVKLCGGEVFSDASLLGIILRNFLDNAIKYTNRGTVRIECRQTPTSVRFEVEDTGPGISPEQQLMIFQDYYQVGDDANASRNGLGLGLAIVKRIAGLLGCEIGCVSELGIGSRFWLEVPTV